MSANIRQLVADSLNRLLTTHAMAVARLEETLANLKYEGDLISSALSLIATSSELNAAQSVSARESPVVDRTLLSVVFRGRSCFLGNTLALHFFERLAKRPNHYLTYQQLLADVWHGPRSNEAVRAVAQTLRRKLKQAHMDELAAAIDGRNPGHFGLILESKR